MRKKKLLRHELIEKYCTFCTCEVFTFFSIFLPFFFALHFSWVKTFIIKPTHFIFSFTCLHQPTEIRFVFRFVSFQFKSTLANLFVCVSLLFIRVSWRFFLATFFVPSLLSMYLCVRKIQKCGRFISSSSFPFPLFSYLLSGICMLCNICYTFFAVIHFYLYKMYAQKRDKQKVKKKKII